MTYTDTHCHIHESTYEDQEGAYARAMEAGVRRLICVGTEEQSSREAVEFARTHENTWASVGLHPHDAQTGVEAIHILERLIEDDKKDHMGKIVAIGECGLDYFYDNSPREQQIEMLRAQLDLASRFDLPVIFHVRDTKNPADSAVWADFWPIFDSYKDLRGVLHSFTDNLSNLHEGLSRGLLIGVNGIATFAKDPSQQEMYASIPLESLVIETDAPYLTPVPHRGSVNEPAYIPYIAQHVATIKNVELTELSRVSEQNVNRLFNL